MALSERSSYSLFFFFTRDQICTYLKEHWSLSASPQHLAHPMLPVPVGTSRRKSRALCHYSQTVQWNEKNIVCTTLQQSLIETFKCLENSFVLSNAFQTWWNILPSYHKRFHNSLTFVIIVMRALLKIQKVIACCFTSGAWNMFFFFFFEVCIQQCISVVFLKNLRFCQSLFPFKTYTSLKLDNH